MTQEVSGANLTVHRFLWSSPGSFRKSLRPLSVNKGDDDGTSERGQQQLHRLNAGTNQSAHMSFTTSCLSVGKTGGHPPLEDGLHQRLGGKPASVAVV